MPLRSSLTDPGNRPWERTEGGRFLPPEPNPSRPPSGGQTRAPLRGRGCKGSYSKHGDFSSSAQTLPSPPLLAKAEAPSNKAAGPSPRAGAGLRRPAGLTPALGEGLKGRPARAAPDPTGRHVVSAGAEAGLPARPGRAAAALRPSPGAALPPARGRGQRCVGSPRDGQVAWAGGPPQPPSPRLSAGASSSGRSILSCAAGGVFMAACLLDVVPDSLADLRDELRRRSLSVRRGRLSRGRASQAARRAAPLRVWRGPLTPRGPAGNDLAAFDRVPEPLPSPKGRRAGSFGPAGRPR